MVLAVRWRSGGRRQRSDAAFENGLRLFELGRRRRARGPTCCSSWTRRTRASRRGTARAPTTRSSITATGRGRCGPAGRSAPRPTAARSCPCSRPRASNRSGPRRGRGRVPAQGRRIHRPPRPRPRRRRAGVIPCRRCWLLRNRGRGSCKKKAVASFSAPALGGALSLEVPVACAVDAPRKKPNSFDHLSLSCTTPRVKNSSTTSTRPLPSRG